MEGKTEIGATQDVRFCASCDAERATPDGRFCSKCGAGFSLPLTDPTVRTDPAVEIIPSESSLHPNGTTLAVAQLSPEAIRATELVLAVPPAPESNASAAAPADYVVVQRPARLPWLVAAGAITVALALALWGWVLLSQRDAVIVQWSQRAEELSSANIALQGELKQLADERATLLETRELLSQERAELRVVRDRLSGERDQLSADRDRLLVERGRLADERNGLAGERDRLAAEKNDLAGQVASTKREKELTAEELADAERRESQARREGERQQGRAQAAEQFNAALIQLLRVDDQIHAEYQTLVENVAKMYVATTRSSVDFYYNLVRRSGDRLSQLFRDRDTQIARLRS